MPCSLLYLQQLIQHIVKVKKKKFILNENSRYQRCIYKELYYIFGRCYSLSGIIHMKDKSVPHITKGSFQCEKSRETAKNMKKYLKNQCVCVLSHFSRVRLFVTLDCSLPSSSVHGILQARILEWIAMPSCKRSSQPRD